MGTRVRQSSSATKVKAKGLNARSTDGLVEISPTLTGFAWPILAKRLEIQGALKGVHFHKGRVFLRAEEDGLHLPSLHRRHARKSKLKPFVLASLAIPVVVLAATLPLGSRSDESNRNQKQVVTNPCGEDQLRNWLTTGNDGGEIKTLEASLLGGVISGTFECLDARYSYTLGSEEPKRVLKLQKLDS
jgi:hypothetical protein